MEQDLERSEEKVELSERFVLFVMCTNCICSSCWLSEIFYAINDQILFIILHNCRNRRIQVLPEGLQKELKIDKEKSEIAFNAPRFVAPTTIVVITYIFIQQICKPTAILKSHSCRKKYKKKFKKTKVKCQLVIFYVDIAYKIKFNCCMKRVFC